MWYSLLCYMPHQCTWHSFYLFIFYILSDNFLVANSIELIMSGFTIIIVQELWGVYLFWIFYIPYSLSNNCQLFLSHRRTWVAQRAARAKPHTYRNWTNQRNLCIEIGNPCMSFFIVILVSSICLRARAYIRRAITYMAYITSPCLLTKSPS